MSGLPALDLPSGLEHLAASVALVDKSPHALPSRRFLERDVLCEAVLRLRASYPEARLTDLAMLWARMYGFRLLAAALPAALLFDRRMPIALDETRMVLDPGDGCPLCLQVPHAGRVFETDDPFMRLRPAIRDHLGPVLDAVAHHTSAQITVLHGDAAVNFHGIADEVAGAAFRTGRRLGCDVAPLSTAKVWPDGARNILRTPFLPRRKGKAGMIRRTCCLHYPLKDSNGFCDSCPVAEKRRRLCREKTHGPTGIPVAPPAQTPR